jgi:hypothetical protein
MKLSEIETMKIKISVLYTNVQLISEGIRTLGAIIDNDIFN